MEIAGYVIGLKERNLVIMMLNEIMKMRKSDNTRIIVIGAGGAGCNTIGYMLDKQIDDECEYVAVYTTRKQERKESNYRGVAIGQKLTRGIGAGGDPQRGERAAEESEEEIRKAINGADMVFVTCGMGGGTGTGAAPVIARIARQMGILTVGVVTKPFHFEGGKRMKIALEGIEWMKKETDSLVVIPNDRILEMVDKRVTMADALRISDMVLVQAIRSITNIIRQNGLMNLDFADIRTIMKDKGQAYIGTGASSGEGRAVKASEQAVHSRLLETDIRSATDIMLNISGDIDIGDVQEAADYIAGVVGDNVNLILGMIYEEDTEDQCKLTLIATGPAT